MFDELVESSPKKKKTNKPWTIFLSLMIQVFVVVVFILIPLIYTEAIDLKQFSSTLLVAPPPPPPPPPPVAQPITRVKPIARIMQAGKMMAPTVIPKQVNLIKEEELPPDAGAVGVVGGVPGGVPGGQAGGVLGGIIGGIAGSNLPPPPKETLKRIVVGGNVQMARLISQPRPV